MDESNVKKITEYFERTFTLSREEAFRERLLEKEDFLLLTQSNIVRLFIKEEIDIDLDNLKLNEINFILQKGLEVGANYVFSEKENTTLSENDNIDINVLYSAFSEKILRINKNIDMVFLDVFSKISADLKKIEETIQICKGKLNQYKIDDENNHTYDISKMKYFIDMNLEAQKEIVNFLHTDFKQYILKEATPPFPLISDFFDKSPYHYAWAPFVYSPDQLFTVEVKFAFETVRYRDPYNLYISDRPGYYLLLDKYIKENDITKEILDIVEKNHLLHERVTLFKEAISDYQTNKYSAFINIAVLQIEGLFSEYLNHLGINRNNKIEKGLTLIPKLERIKELKVRGNSTFLGYEYFVFEFPVLRNKVAHGGIVEKVEETAHEILLDLYYLIRTLDSDELPINEAVNLMKNIDISDLNSIYNILTAAMNNNFLMEIITCENTDHELILFYGLKDQVEGLRNSLLNKNFSDYIIKKIEECKDCNSIRKLVDFSKTFEKKNIFSRETSQNISKCVGRKKKWISVEAAISSQITKDQTLTETGKELVAKDQKVKLEYVEKVYEDMLVVIDEHF